MAQPLAKPHFRRIVTKHDSRGKAAIWIDANATNHKFPNKKISSTLMWSTDGSPTLILSDEDAGDRILGSAPPPCGSRFTMMEFQPGNEATLHRTDTVDYVICLSGEIDMFWMTRSLSRCELGRSSFSGAQTTPVRTAAISRAAWLLFCWTRCPSERGPSLVLLARGRW